MHGPRLNKKPSMTQPLTSTQHISTNYQGISRDAVLNDYSFDISSLHNENITDTTPSGKQATNKSGLPDNLKAGIENLSGYSMDDVNIHYNSDKPAQIQAHAYTQGTDIHIASGQEKHLPHEAWHVVQQKQGRVRPTLQMKENVTINNDSGLEREADIMGMRANQISNNQTNTASRIDRLNTTNNTVMQCKYTAYGTDFTENRKFGVRDDDNYLYALPQNKPAPNNFFKSDGTADLDTLVKDKKQDRQTKKFNKFSPVAKFDSDRKNWKDYVGPNDCLYYASALATDSPRWDTADSNNKNSRWNPMKQKHDNKAPDFEKSHDDGKDPDIGVQETYYMRYGDQSKIPSGQSRHHGSTVIGVDGKDKVTSEADAGDTSRKVPQFEMYGPAGNGSFYEMYSGYFTDTDKNDAVITVLKP